MSNLRYNQLAFALTAVGAAAFFALCEKGVLPTGYLGGQPQVQYVLDVVCAALCMGGTWGALRLMRFARPAADLKARGEAAYGRWAAVRTAVVGLCVFVELFVYYATLQSQTAHYALMISIIAALFCVPTQRECDTLTHKDDEPCD
ncbi:MAG: hypothetical protein J6M53_06480 [Bacteroidaceae bacterium]|nr:hypothetical protein [Bacteroidaceae bacterium]